MRIAIVTDYYYPMLGGITEHVHGQARELARRGHEVTVVTGHLLRTPPIADPGARSEADEGFDVVRLGMGVPLYGNASQTIHTVPAGLVLQLRRLFKRLKVDVVHLHAPYNPSMCAIAPLAIPDGAIGVATYHSVFAPGVLLDVFAPILRRWLGRLDAHVVVSEACIGSLAPYFPYDYRIIPNGIDDRHFSPDAEPLPELREGGKPLILFLGRFDPRNGLPTMLEAFEQRPRRARGLGAPVRRRRRAARQRLPAQAPRAGRRGRDLGRPRRLVAARATTPRPTSTARPASVPRSAWCCSRRWRAGGRSWPAASPASSC